MKTLKKHAFLDTIELVPKKVYGSDTLVAELKDTGEWYIVGIEEVFDPKTGGFHAIEPPTHWT